VRRLVCLLREPAAVADGRERVNDPVDPPMLPNHEITSFPVFNR
jgi:hypothetical protein